MKNTLSLLITFLFSQFLFGQDTFSIVAVDSATREVGSAGASCIDNSYIISDVFPNKGAAHTQAWWDITNQGKIRQFMNSGLAPQEIIDYIVANDSKNWGRDSTYRQYGIVDFGDSTNIPRSAGHTGSNADDYKSHKLGSGYAIQGNILLGPQVLDSIENAFLRTKGQWLGDRLMSAMIAASFPGADARCLNIGLSTFSAFVRVAKPTDEYNELYLDLNVREVDTVGKDSSDYIDPIDSLQIVYNNWKDTVTSVLEKNYNTNAIKVYPNPFTESTTFYFNEAKKVSILTIFNLLGFVIESKNISSETSFTFNRKDISNGVYFYKIEDAGAFIASGKLVVF